MYISGLGMYSSIADAAFRSPSLMGSESPSLAMMSVAGVFYGYLFTSIIAIHLRMRSHTKLLIRSQDELAKDKAIRYRSFFYADYIALFIIPVILTSIFLGQILGMLHWAEQVEYLSLLALLSITIQLTKN
jgi:hypothetical protein